MEISEVLIRYNTIQSTAAQLKPPGHHKIRVPRCLVVARLQLDDNLFNIISAAERMGQRYVKYRPNANISSLETTFFDILVDSITAYILHLQLRAANVKKGKYLDNKCLKFILGMKLNIRQAI